MSNEILRPDLPAISRKGRNAPKAPEVLELPAETVVDTLEASKPPRRRRKPRQDVQLPSAPVEPPPVATASDAVSEEGSNGSTE